MRKESLDVLSSLAIENIVEIYSQSIPRVFFIDDILSEKELKKKSRMLLSFTISTCLERFNIIDCSVV